LQRKDIVIVGAIEQISLRPDPEEHTPPLIDLLQILWKQVWLIAVVASCFTGVVVGYSVMQPPEYEASVRILIGQEHRRDPLSSLSVESLQQTTQTMVEAIDSRAIAEDVTQQLDSDMTPQALVKNMSVEQVGTTQFIEVSYVAESPKEAQQVANTIGEVVSSRTPDMNISANVITATVYERALVPDSPVSPNPVRNGVVALVPGLMLGVGLAFLLEYLHRATKPYRKGKG
jgi:capsular polysaccharide biosynthesis protein